MNKHMDSRGVSLVEVLAALVLLSMIFLLIISTQLFGEREYNTQNEQFSNDVSLQFVIKDITREIRRIDNNNKIKIDPQKSELIIGENVYILSNKGLMKNSSILADNIQEFKLEFNNSWDTLKISIITNGSDRSEKEIVTSIFLREGDSR